MDCVVKSWITSTISPDLAETVIDRDASARTISCALEDQFLSNRETHALHLDVQFRNLVQGDLSISDFCRHLKSMAQQLVDLGEHVTDRTLTLNLIRGLNERFSDAGRHIRRGNPFPKFKDAVNELILEELTMAHQHSAPSTALLAAGKGAPSGAPPPSSSSGAHPPSSPPATGAPTPGVGIPAASPRIGADGAASLAPARHRRPLAVGSSGAPSWPPRLAQAGAPWPSFLHLWAGAIQMWPSPRPSTPLPVAPTPP